MPVKLYRLRRSSRSRAFTHAGLKARRNPGEQSELRVLAVLAQANGPVAAEREPEHEAQEARGDQQVQPADASMMMC